MKTKYIKPQFEVIDFECSELLSQSNPEVISSGKGIDWGDWDDNGDMDPD
jgi:hypothetical protein